jgi:hypothetical protein
LTYYGRHIGETAEYKLDRGTQNRSMPAARPRREGRLQSGKKLKYGVVMKPNCMSPTTARFARLLPESEFGRWKNYLLFNVIEAFWPGKEEQIRTADAQRRSRLPNEDRLSLPPDWRAAHPARRFLPGSA